MRLDEVRFAVMAVKTLNDAESGAPVVEVVCLRLQKSAEGNANNKLQVAARWHALVNPEVLPSEDFTRQTGIYPADLRNQPLLEDILPDLARFVGRDLIVWTHSPRRTNALHRHFKLTQARERELFLQALAQAVLPELNRYTLSSLLEMLDLMDNPSQDSGRAQLSGSRNEPLTMRHAGQNRSELIANLQRAEDMAEAAARCFLKLLDIAQAEHGVETLADLLEFCPPPKKDTRRMRRNLPFDRDRLRQYPLKPGVYFMKNRTGDILYVGKAKCLRERLRSYFQAQHRLSPKIAAMMKQVTAIDVVTVGSELEALLLEARLIKQHQPFFNKMVKDYRGMAFLKISVNALWPRLSAVEEPDDPAAAYCGPFPRKISVERHMDVLNRVFLLRSCTDSEFRQHAEAPCLQYNLRQCSAPCAGLVSKTDYASQVRDFLYYLSGEPSATLSQLEARRDAYADALQFEKAAQVQALLAGLEQLQLKTAGLQEAFEARHCLIALPDAEPGALRMLAVLHGQPALWRTLRQGPAYAEENAAFVDEVLSLLESHQQPQASRGASVTAPAMAPVIAKDQYEEARLLAQWLDAREENDGAVIPLKDRSRTAVLRDLNDCLQARSMGNADSSAKNLLEADNLTDEETLDLDEQPVFEPDAILFDEDWERELSAG